MTEPTRRPARIRLTEESANILLDLLEAAQDVFWTLRTRAKEEGADTSGHNRRLRVIRKLLDEVERTMEEEGW